MPNEPPGQNEVRQLRQAMDGFIQERLKPKLEEVEKKLGKADDPDKRRKLEADRDKLMERFQTDYWLADAARRAGQIQYITHAQKYSHPNARGDSRRFASKQSQSPDGLLGSHCMAGDLPGDVVGNAAALDVFKFLSVECQGRTLLERVDQNEPAMAMALSDDPATARQLMDGFGAITGESQSAASHTLTRQVYFPLPEGGYHLLAPLYPSSLVHALYRRLREARFSEQTKDARQARREGRAHADGYRDFPDLAIQAFGGTKPQNISQLNAERHGESWLLSSLPPNWDTQALRPPLNSKTVFLRFYGRRPAVLKLARSLARFLSATDYNNKNIRQGRATLVNGLVDQLMQMAAELHQLEPGWSADSECRLPQEERLWLDPGRGLEDPEFAAQRASGDWQEQVAARFGNWLNARVEGLQRGPVKLHMGADEHAAWKKEVADNLKGLREELSHV